MSNLPGNPYLPEAEHDNGSENFINLAQAMLALAYEQRTANMLAYMQPVKALGGKEMVLSANDILQMSRRVQKRMGL